MYKNLSTRWSHLLSVSTRLGLPLILAALATLFLTALVSISSSALGPAAPLGDGDLDTTFGAGGIVTTTIGPGWEVANDIAIQPDGKIVIAGSSYSSASYYDFSAARYTISGTLDTTFGNGGVVTTPIGTRLDFGQSLAIQPDGKIVVAGYADNGKDNDFAIVRYTISGALDTTFGATGIVTTSVGPEDDYAFSLAIQPDGKIVAAGKIDNGSDDDIAVVRYTISGTLDTTFGSGGIVTTSIGVDDEYASSVAVQPDGKIVLVGSVDNGIDDDFIVLRYTTSGTLDTTFGTDGIVTTSISLDDDYAYDLAIQSDGKIVAVGSAENDTDEDFALVRYTTSGAQDTTFGISGIITTPIGTGNEFASSVAIQSDGKILATGSAHNGSDYDFAVVRYTGSGALDTSFGANGVVTTPIGATHDHSRGIAVQQDSRIVVVGYQAWGPLNADIVLVRYQTEIHAIYLPMVVRK